MKIALVTGGSRGIGRAISLRLAREGYHVIVHFFRNYQEAENTAALITENGGSCELTHFNAADFNEIKKCLDDILATHQINVLVLNAGIRHDNLLGLMTSSQWETVIDTNLNSFFYITKPVIKQMLLNRNGSVVVISSASGQTGREGQTNYAASKAGLLGATKALALECARRNVRVNAVAPGFIATQMTDGSDIQKLYQTIPLKRFGRPEEVAGVVAFLCSEDSAYITGQVIAVNGGVYM